MVSLLEPSLQYLIKDLKTPTVKSPESLNEDVLHRVCHWTSPKSRTALHQKVQSFHGHETRGAIQGLLGHKQAQEKVLLELNWDKLS